MRVAGAATGVTHLSGVIVCFLAHVLEEGGHVHGVRVSRVGGRRGGGGGRGGGTGGGRGHGHGAGGAGGGNTRCSCHVRRGFDSQAREREGGRGMAGGEKGQEVRAPPPGRGTAEVFRPNVHVKVKASRGGSACLEKVGGLLTSF